MDDRELRLFQHRNGGLGRRLRQGLARPGLLAQGLQLSIFPAQVQHGTLVGKQASLIPADLRIGLRQFPAQQLCFRSRRRRLPPGHRNSGLHRPPRQDRSRLVLGSHGFLHFLQSALGAAAIGRCFGTETLNAAQQAVFPAAQPCGGQRSVPEYHPMPPSAHAQETRPLPGALLFLKEDPAYLRLFRMASSSS